MKKFLHSRDGASKGAALIIVLGLVVLATANAINTAQGIAGRNVSIDVRQGRGSINNAEHAMATSPDTACVSITSAQIINPGSSYTVGDNLAPAYGNLCSPADDYGFRLRVASVNSGGGVTAVTIISGIGYSAPPSNPIGFGGSATGTGFTANCTFH